MPLPPLDSDVEARRQELVESLDPETLAQDDTFDLVSRAMAAIWDTRKAHVSLMESDVQRVVGEVGLERTTFDRENTFCNYALEQGEIFIVENAAEDDRFHDNPLVDGSPYIRFYAGIPVMVDEISIGTLCALETAPREIDYDMRLASFDLLRQLEQNLQLQFHSEQGDPKLEMSTKLTSLEACMTIAAQHGTCSHVESTIGIAREKIQESYDLLDRLSGGAQSDLHSRLSLGETVAESDDESAETDE